MSGVPLKTFSIFTGDSKTIFLKAIYAENFSPLDLTDCTEIDIAIPNFDGTFTHLLLSTDDVAVTSPAILGQFTGAITSEESLLFLPGEFQNIDVTFTISGAVMTVRYFQALSVFENS